MHSYQVSKSIAASPDRVWGLLTDAAAYPSWNKAVDSVEGTIALGETIKLFVPTSPGRAFPAKVSTFEKPRRMVWAGGMPLGVFTAERSFTMEASDGGTNFSMQEVYSGLLAGMISRQIPDLSGSFEEFGESLKVAAEKSEGG